MWWPFKSKKKDPEHTPLTHDYRRHTHGYGHSIGYRPLPNNKLSAYGWGPLRAIKMCEGDYIMLSNGSGETRYQIEKIRYEYDPPDQWFATLRFAPRQVPNG